MSLFIFVACEQSNPQKNSTSESVVIQTKVEGDSLKLNVQKDLILKESDYNPEEYRRESLNLTYKKATLFKLTETISADFNGDGVIDKAIYVRESGTSGIVITHGKSNEEHRIGFGEQFAHMTEFDWVNYWGLVMDKRTSEASFNEDGEILGSKYIKLQNLSIALAKDEVGGGLITYLNGKYVWIHQTC